MRSLVPNEKNSASAAIWSAVIAPRGTSIIVPTQILHPDAALLHHVGGDPVDDGLLIAQLFHVADERNHDLRYHLHAFLGEVAGGLDDGARLHLGDLRIGDAEADATVAEHRVELVQLFDPPQQGELGSSSGPVLLCDFELGDVHHQLLALRQELVERRIDGPDRDRQCRASPLKTP